MKNYKKDAIWYWQDKLAKFFPTSEGPTNTEKMMFEYGYLEGINSNESNLSLALEALEDIANRNISANGFNYLDSAYEARAQEAINKIKRVYEKP